MTDCPHDNLTAHVVTPVWMPAKLDGTTVIVTWEDAGYGRNELRALSCDNCKQPLDVDGLEVF